MPINRQILLNNRPVGPAVLDNFKMVENHTPDLVEGQVLVKNIFLSLDPYMRGRMNDSKNYKAPQLLGYPMVGGTVGEITETKNNLFKIGDKVVCMGGWQDFSVENANVVGAVRKVDTIHVPLSVYLGAVGMPGVTAWYGLNKIIEPKEGETMLVSAATGAVGSAFSALSKENGCRTVGVAGGEKKCSYAIEELGFDACIDYKLFSDTAHLATAIQQACPNGVDGYFENVGGKILDAAMMVMNDFGRIAVCGMIAGYNGEPLPMNTPSLILRSRLKTQGFIVSEHMEVWPQALSELYELYKVGKLRPRETIAEGLESAPQAFLGLLKGQNIGKQLVKLC